MKKSTVGYIAGIVFCLGLSIALVAFIPLYDVSAQTAQSTPTSQPTPSSVLPLEMVIATQQVQIDDLTRRVADLEHEEKNQLQDIASKLDQKLFYLGAIAIAISAVVTFFGWRTYHDLDQIIRNKISKTLDKELYRLDPTMLVIRIREGEDQEKIKRRLLLTGLNNIKVYTTLGKDCLQGITIVPIESADDQKDFCKFLYIYKNELFATRAAFILYTKHKLNDKVFEFYDNLITANMPATVASSVLTVGRGLRSLEDKEKKLDEKYKPCIEESDLEKLIW
jgi:hypothetical protein